ncbi:MAG: hypothetical protein IIC50_10490 [Planctomycetes bacterium]|nr:hypothetical protein [Planctomycetota bacterium]
MNVRNLSFSRESLRWVAPISLGLAVLFIGIGAVWGEAIFPLQHGGDISPGWDRTTLPDIPELPNIPTLPEIPTLSPMPAKHDTASDYPEADSSDPSYRPYDPFADLYGWNVLAHLEGDQVISGFLMQVSEGYVVLEQLHINRTFVVNTAKVLYFEATEIH